MFGCAIDGQKSAEGEAEMAERFGEPMPGDWEFRQFMAIRPIGDADEETTAKLRHGVLPESFLRGRRVGGLGCWAADGPPATKLFAKWSTAR